MLVVGHPSRGIALGVWIWCTVVHVALFRRWTVFSMLLLGEGRIGYCESRVSREHGNGWFDVTACLMSFYIVFGHLWWGRHRVCPGC